MLRDNCAFLRDKNFFTTRAKYVQKFFIPIFIFFLIIWKLSTHSLTFLQICVLFLIGWDIMYLQGVVSCNHWWYCHETLQPQIYQYYYAGVGWQNFRESLIRKIQYRQRAVARKKKTFPPSQTILEGCILLLLVESVNFEVIFCLTFVLLCNIST